MALACCRFLRRRVRDRGPDGRRRARLVRPAHRDLLNRVARCLGRAVPCSCVGSFSSTARVIAASRFARRSALLESVRLSRLAPSSPLAAFCRWRSVLLALRDGSRDGEPSWPFFASSRLLRTRLRCRVVPGGFLSDRLASFAADSFPAFASRSPRLPSSGLPWLSSPGGDSGTFSLTGGGGGAGSADSGWPAVVPAGSLSRAGGVRLTYPSNPGSSGSQRNGSVNSPVSRSVTEKWRCGPVENPTLPTSPIGSPAWT